MRRWRGARGWRHGRGVAHHVVADGEERLSVLLCDGRVCNLDDEVWVLGSKLGQVLEQKVPKASICGVDRSNTRAQQQGWPGERPWSCVSESMGKCSRARGSATSERQCVTQRGLGGEACRRGYYNRSGARTCDFLRVAVPHKGQLEVEGGPFLDGFHWCRYIHGKRRGMWVARNRAVEHSDVGFRQRRCASVIMCLGLVLRHVSFCREEWFDGV